MTNTEILRRIELSGLHPNDLIEVIRIFEIMTNDKKVEILERWDSIVAEIKRHREQIEKEKEILLVRALENIEHDLEAYNRRQIQKSTKEEMSIFQQEI